MVSESIDPPLISRPASDFDPEGARDLRFETSRGDAQPRWVVAPAAPPVIELESPAPRFLLHQARFHVGDTLWLTPLLRAIHRRFVGARTTVVGPPVAAQVLGGNSNVDELLIYPEEGGFQERQEVLRALADSPLEVAIFAFARRPESCWLAAATAEMDVAHRINLEYFDPELDHRKVWGNVTHEGWFHWGSMASPRMLLHALDLFAGDSGSVDRRVELPISEASRSRAREVLDSHGIDGPFALLAPGGRSSQRWPAEHFAQLAASLASDLGLHVLVEGAPDEEFLLQRVAGLADCSRVVASQDSLGVFAALLERCRLLVSNDSAPIHLAEAVAAPTLYFAQQEKLLHSHPVGERVWALFDDQCNDVTNISVRQVMAAVRELVGGLGAA